MALVTSGWSPWWLGVYGQHFASVNHVGKQWPKAPAFTPLLLPEAFVPLGSFLSSEFYHDGLRFEGEAECCSGMKIFAEGDRQAAICVQYGVRHKDSMHAAFSPLLRALAPRMRRALRANQIAEPAAQPQLVKGDLIHNLLDPAFIIDERRRVLLANHKAETLIAEDECLRVGPHNVLSLGTPQENVGFGRLVREACRRSAASAFYSDFAFEHGGTRIIASILPITTHLQSFVSGGAPFLFAPNALALVVFRIERANGAHDVRTDLRSRYGLTNAEAKIADALRHGGSVSQIANRMGVAYETARNQLKAAFAKTGTHSQRELLQLVFQLSSK